jgi:hypothetical protein
MCPIPNGFRDRVVSLYSSKSVYYTREHINYSCPILCVWERERDRQTEPWGVSSRSQQGYYDNTKKK